jgi:hypothetical protein
MFIYCISYFFLFNHPLHVGLWKEFGGAGGGGKFGGGIPTCAGG